MDTETKTVFFSTLPKITELIKKAQNFRQVSPTMKAFKMDRCKECVKHAQAKFEGDVDFTTMKGLAYFKKANDLLASFVPYCSK